nr:lipocalin family protein [Paraburkholderia phenoliruptrix]
MIEVNSGEGARYMLQFPLPIRDGERLTVLLYLRGTLQWFRLPGNAAAAQSAVPVVAGHGSRRSECDTVESDIAMYKSIACIAACILCFAGCAQSPAIPPPTACTAGAPLDLTRYMGRWYVIADTPFLSEHDYVGNYDEFTLLADGKIDDRYLGRRHDFGQPVTGSHFVAKVIPGTGNTKWRVGLIWPFEIVVITAYVDPEYRYTIRCMADGNMVWVLARDPQMDEGAYRDVLARLAAMGFHTDLLRRVPQKPEQMGQPGFQ